MRSLAALTVVLLASLTAHEAVAQVVPASDVYSVTLQIDPRKADGSAWDPDGSPPDVRLAVLTPGGAQEQRDVCPLYVCEFPQVYIPRGSAIRIYDADVLENDLIGQGVIEGLGSGERVQVRLGQAQVWVESAEAAAARRSADAAARRDAATQARELADDEVRALLVRQAVVMASGVRWTFEPAEPFESRIVRQGPVPGGSSVTVYVRTNSIDGRSPAEGQIELILSWLNGVPTLRGTRSIDFGLR